MKELSKKTEPSILQEASSFRRSPKEGKTDFYFHCINMSLATSFSQRFHGELNPASN